MTRQLPPGLSKLRFSMASVLSALSATALLLAVVPAASAQIVQINHQSWTNIVSATSNGWMHFPRAVSFDIDSGGVTVKKLLVNWQTNADVVQFPMTHGYAGSANGGATWASPSPITTTSPDLDLMGCVRLKSGELLAIPFYPNPSVAGTTSFTFSYKTSTDNGLTWTNHANAGTVSGNGNTFGGFRFHRDIIEEANGDLYAAAYPVLTNLGDTAHRSSLFKSTNGGVNWTYLSTMQYTAGLDYNETAIVRCKNGDFLAVMRNHTGSTYNDLKYRRSTNKGASWTGATSYLPGLPTPNAGVDPQLILMPNGILVLTFGKHRGAPGRDIHMAFSADGNGASWSNDITTFTGVSGSSESTGYTSVALLSAHRFAQIGDTGGPAYYATQHPSPNPFKIRSKIVDVVTAQRNRIDLQGKATAGTLTVTTDMTYTNAANPEARTTGAYDGSVNYWSGAFKSATSGTYTLDLEATYPLSAIGVCLQYNTAESATVEYSTNGTTWTTAKTYTNAVHNAIDYTTLAAVPARYIRVTATLAASPVSLNEIEVYSTADTFENYAQNITPYGYTAANGGFTVSQSVGTPTGYQSNRALYLNDNDGTDKTITKTVTASATKTLEFWIRPKAYAASNAAIQWRLMSGATNVFRLRVVSGGQVSWYNGSTYTNIGGANVLPLDTWKLVKVVANASTNQASLYVDGVLVGAANAIGEQGAGAATINGLLFSSGGASANGDQALFDDVSIN